MSNTRSSAPPSMIVVAEPAPLIVRSPLMSRSPVAALFSFAPAIVRVYVPAGSVMMSAPALALAAMIASRSEQSEYHTPSLVSAVLVTTKVFARAEAGARRRRTPTTNTPRTW
jgi:hypothetical protein